MTLGMSASEIQTDANDGVHGIFTLKPIELALDGRPGRPSAHAPFPPTLSLRVAGGITGSGYQRSLPVGERAAYTFFNATHLLRNKRDFHA